MKEDFDTKATKEMSKKEFEKLMIEGYKETAEEDLKICEEFKYVDAENLPEWDED